MLTLPLKRKRAKVNLSPDVCNKLVVSEVRLGVNLATLTGQLHVKDNHHSIQVCVVLGMFGCDCVASEE